MSAVVVAAAHRGRGICALLMQMAQAPRDTRHMVLEVDKTNMAAIRCYTSAGFVVNRRVPERHLGYIEMRRKNLAHI